MIKLILLLSLFTGCATVNNCDIIRDEVERYQCQQEVLELNARWNHMDLRSGQRR